jgi:hypothetical protein
MNDPRAMTRSSVVSVSREVGSSSIDPVARPRRDA